MSGTVQNTIATLKSVQRGTISLAAAFTGSATVTAVNTAKSTLDLLGSSNDGSTPDKASLQLVLTNGTTVSASRGASSASCTVSYELKEWY